MVKTLNDLNAQSNMINEFEFPDSAIVDRATQMTQIDRYAKLGNVR